MFFRFKLSSTKAEELQNVSILPITSSKLCDIEKTVSTDGILNDIDGTSILQADSYELLASTGPDIEADASMFLDLRTVC